MTAITTTSVSVPSASFVSTLPGDMTAEAVATAYQSLVSGIEAMAVTETIEGSVKTLTFKPKTGEKGADITSTEVSVPSASFVSTLPGDMTAEAVATAYQSLVSGIEAMAVTETVNGNVKTLTFKPKTGEKGADILTTEVSVPSASFVSTLPGDMTAEAVATAYQSLVSGIEAMAVTETVNGSVKTLTFKPKTGEKGQVA